MRAFFPDDASIENDTSVSATAPGQTLVADLTLDVSVIKGRVLELDASTPVAGALVEVRSFGATERVPATVNPNGSFFVLNEPEGLYEIVAEDAFGLVGYAATELAPAVLVAEQDVLLPEHGTVEGFVTDAFGSPLADAPVELTNANVLQVRSTLPDANGYFLFERVAFGSFSLTYDHPTGAPAFIPVPAVGAGALDPMETLASVSLVVPETGTVFGELRDDAGVVLPGGEGGNATLEGREHESSGGIYSRPADVDMELMSYSEDGVPAGEVTVVGEDFTFGDVGVASGTLAAGGTLELNPEMGAGVFVPYEPEPGATERHEVQPNGALLGEADGVTGDAPFFGFLHVNQKAPPALAGATVELSGSQLVLGPMRSAGVLHTRKVHVPAGAPYARYLDIFANPGSIPMEVSLHLEADLWVDGGLTTSSGDAVVDPSDRYVAGESADGTAVAVVFAGETSSVLADFTGADLDLFTQDWRRITIPAGGRVILMHFAIQAPDLATAVSRANSLIGLSSASSELSDLTSAERSDIVNYDLP